MSLKGIIKGYGNAALEKAGLGAPEKARVANERLNVCNGCEIYNRPTCVKSKGGCGCNMEKKVFYDKAKCPKNKW